MTTSLFHRTPLQEAFAALRRDLIHEDGPRISTMRNYRFAIVQYEPEDEFKLRSEVQRLSSDLVANGWMVLSINLQKLLLDRVRAQGDDWAERVIEMEKRMASIEPSARPQLPEVEAHAAHRRPRRHRRRLQPSHLRLRRRSTPTTSTAPSPSSAAPARSTPSSARRRSCATSTAGPSNVPVVLLYPGERRGATGLSFMGMLEPDNDYRPRIYP